MQTFTCLKGTYYWLTSEVYEIYYFPVVHRRGTVLVADSHNNDWVFIVKSVRPVLSFCLSFFLRFSSSFEGFGVGRSLYILFVCGGYRHFLAFPLIFADHFTTHCSLCSIFVISQVCPKMIFILVAPSFSGLVLNTQIISGACFLLLCAISCFIRSGMKVGCVTSGYSCLPCKAQ